MSQEAEDFEDAFDVEDLDPELLGDKEDDERPEEPEEKPSEPSVPKGYMDKEAWVAAGKNIDDWRSPEVFAETRKRIEETSRLRRELREKEEGFENRIKNLNALQQKQLSRQRQELLDRRDDAIDVADKAAVKRIDKELKDLDDEAELVADKKDAPQKPPEVVEWESENPWCNDANDPRLPVAQKVFKDALEAGKTMAGALRLVDREIAAMGGDKKAASDKPRKTPISMADSSKTTSTSRSDSSSLAWKDLTREELAYYEDLYSDMTRKEYLQAVADSRKGA